jgi:hypothetical protein
MESSQGIYQFYAYQGSTGMESLHEQDPQEQKRMARISTEGIVMAPKDSVGHCSLLSWTQKGGTTKILEASFFTSTAEYPIQYTPTPSWLVKQEDLKLEE